MFDVREVFYTQSFLADHFNTYPSVHCAIVRVVAIFHFPSILFRCSQQVMDLAKALQEKLIEEKLKMQTSKVTAVEKAFQGIGKQLISFENACR